MMRRDECFRRIAELRGEAIVVSTYTSAFEWREISPSGLNYFSVGAMGQASSHALGLALGLPRQKVVVLDGDGSLLMNLASLVTIAEAAPRNLVHFVAENGCYEANGSHPIPGRDRVDFAGLARAAGYARVFEFDGLNRFAAELPDVMSAPGPVFVTLKIVAGEAPALDYEWLHSERVREDFKDAVRPLIARRGARI